MTEAEKEAARRWPLDGGDPETIFALRRAFVKGAEWQASRAPQPTDDDREALARIVNDEHQGTRTWAELKARAPSWRSNGDDYAIRTAYKTADALLAAGFRRAPAAPAVQGDAKLPQNSAVTDEMVEAALAWIGRAWDDGNATGLDGWVGPGRGAGEVDREAQHARTRLIHKAEAALRAALTTKEGQD